ncbi:MAG: MBL fold metallo-hydrolase [Pseudomonadota bacterium]
MRNRIRSVPRRLATLFALAMILAGCGSDIPPSESDDDARSDYAVQLESARIEMREGPSEAEQDAPTRVVILGTGTPIPDTNRAGASIAIVHKGESYLFDVGGGSIRNATRARYKYDIPSLYPSEIDAVFLTHMHSDHTVDFVELNFTLWWRRREHLLAFGPTGLEELVDGMVAMMQPDIRTRSSGGQPVIVADAYHPVVSEISAGVVFEKDGMTVEAFDVSHGDIKPAFGYRVTTDDLTVVISGDTAFSETLQSFAAGADILLHESIGNEGLLRNSEAFQAYHKASHTTTADVARLAAEARPELLVLYHTLHYGLPEQNAVDEIAQIYDGHVVLANDLDVFP